MADHAPTVRPAREADAAAIAEIYAPYVLETVISFETEPPAAAEMVARMSAHPAHPWLVAERQGRTVGYAYAAPHAARPAYRWSVNVSVYLDRAHHRAGLGGRLYRSLFSLLRRQGFRSAFAGIALPNAASVGLHEALGFEPIGVYRNVGFKLGRWVDVGYWGLELAPPRTPPEEPVGFGEL